MQLPVVKCKAAELLLELGASIDAPDELGQTPLRRSACQDQIAVVRALVEHGASVNIAGKDGWAPLRCAASQEKRDIAEYAGYRPTSALTALPS